MNDKTARDLVRAIDSNTKELSLIKIAINSSNKDVVEGADKEFEGAKKAMSKMKQFEDNPVKAKAGDKVTIG